MPSLGQYRPIGPGSGSVSGGGTGGGRTLLTGNTSFYVATTGSDSNPGTLAQPWFSLQHAMNYIASKLDIAGFVITVNIGAGSFPGLGMVPSVGGGEIDFVGAGSGSTTITSGPNDGVYNFGECFSSNFNTITYFTFNKVTFAPSAGFAVIEFFSLTQCGLGFGGADVVFNVPTGNTTVLYCSSASSAIGFFAGTYVINGANGYSQFVQAEYQGVVTFTNGAAFTINGTPAANKAFAVADNYGIIVISGVPTFTGATTGKRFFLYQNGSVEPIGVLPLTFFPGNAPGVTDPSANWGGSPAPISVSDLTGNFSASSFPGSRMFVNDSNATLAAGLGNVVVGGGGNNVPVYSDGTNWRIG